MDDATRRRELNRADLARKNVPYIAEYFLLLFSTRFLCGAFSVRKRKRGFL
jgi:hypothetical protein